LGGRHQDMEPIATQALAPAGYESLACDARGHGASGGLFGLDGARDVQDTKELSAWFQQRLGDANIGALGISLGGGAVWNGVTAGVPFKAVVPIITWTNLLTSLAPQGLSKSGLVQYLAGLVPTSKWDPQLLAASQGLATSADLSGAAALASPRSPKLGSITKPTLLVPGRRERQGRAQRPDHGRAARDVRRLDGHRPLLRRDRVGPARRRPRRRRQLDADHRGRRQAHEAVRDNLDQADERSGEVRRREEAR